MTCRRAKIIQLCCFLFHGIRNFSCAGNIQTLRQRNITVCLAFDIASWPLVMLLMHVFILVMCRALFFMLVMHSFSRSRQEEKYWCHHLCWYRRKIHLRHSWDDVPAEQTPSLLVNFWPQSLYPMHLHNPNQTLRRHSSFCSLLNQSELRGLQELTVIT